MSSTIVIIGAGRAPTMRARPATHPRRAGNPRERLRAKGINWATAACRSTSAGWRWPESSRPADAGARYPATWPSDYLRQPPGRSRVRPAGLGGNL